LLAHWGSLDDKQRKALLDDVEQVRFSSLPGLIASHVRAAQPFKLPTEIKPAVFYPARPGIDQAGLYADAVKRGVELIRRNKVAALTVAGGQGTRLGFNGPKGAYQISVVKNKSLFQLFAGVHPGAPTGDTGPICDGTF